MFGKYARILRLPGAFAMSASALIGRLPMALEGLGTVLLITARGGSYGLAGATSATFVLSGSFAGPTLARLIDRRGQSRMLPWLAIGHIAGVGVFVSLVEFHWPTWLFVMVAAFAGALVPNFAVLIRSRWSYLLTGTPGLQTAYALESLLDEVVFIIGPPAATLLSVSVAAPLPLLLSMCFVAAGAILLQLQPRTEPIPTSAERRDESPLLLARGMPVLVTVFVLIGGLFGGFEVTAVAFAQEHGSRAYAGPMLALWSLGSLVGGLAFGARKQATPLPKAFLLSLTVLTLVSAPFYFAPSVPVASMLFLVAGIAVSPTLIAGFSLVEGSAPEGRLNEALSWASTGIGVGIALAATLAGAIIDAHGAHAAFIVGSAATLLALLSAFTGRHEIRAGYHPAAATPSGRTDPGALPGGPEARD